MSAESTDAIDAAIQSAESLFASLLDRTPHSLSRLQSVDHAPILDPETSLIPSAHTPTSPAPEPEGSIVSVGTASLGPANLTAHAHAVYEDFDPRESLSAIASRRSVTSISDSFSYETLYKVLQEKERDLELAAHIGQHLLKRNELLESDNGVLLDTRQALDQQVAQLRHTLSQKEELLRLYARDAHEREQAEAELTEDKPEWVVALTEECRELRDSNSALKMEADLLRKETADIETKERELVQQCLEQFSEAKRSLSEMRERSEESYQENQALLQQLQEVSALYDQEQLQRQQAVEEGEMFKDQLLEAQENISHLTNEVSDLNEQFNMTSVLLKEANDEITALKEISLQSSSPADTGEEQHESIVKEIEEALRKEIHAASMLTERPGSPNHYAHQRTMVIMETVRAATLATARRLERLSTEAKLVPDPQFKPVATSSPNDTQTRRTSRLPRPSPLTRFTPSRQTPLTKATPPSPVPSPETSPASLPGDLVRYQNQSYVAPQKLQIVKPMEGSMTLLKWKLLATPQLGGAKSYFSDASSPGVHLKKWSAAGIKDSTIQPPEGPYDSRMAVSAMDLRELNATYPPARAAGHVRRHKATHTRSKPPPREHPESSRGRGESSSQSNSLLSQFGSFLGSGFSRLKFNRREPSEQPAVSSPETEHMDAGLGGLL